MIKINLIFDRKAIERGRVKQQLSLGVALMMITFGLSGYLWYSQNNKIKSINTNINNSKTKLNSLNAIINKINDREKKKKRLEDIIKAIGELKKIQAGPARVFDEINILISSDVWLTSIVESGGNIKIDGYSFSDPGIATFMKDLDNSKYFSNVELLEIQQTVIEGEKVKKFTLNTTLNLSPEDKAMVSKLADAAKRGGSGVKMVGAGGLYGMGGAIEHMYSKEGIEEYAKKMTEDMKSIPRNPFVEGFKHGKWPQDQKETAGPNIEEAMKGAERLKGEADQKKKEIEERVRKMEEGS